MKSSPAETLWRSLGPCAVLLLVAACGPSDTPGTPEIAAASGAQSPAPREYVVPGKVPVTTASSEALELFLEGRGLLEDLQGSEAHELFVRAVEADPDFAMGHYMVATTSLSAAGYFDAVAKAAALADGVSEGEQLYIESLVAAAANDHAGQLEALKTLADKYPEDERTYMALGIHLYAQQEFRGAARHFAQATATNPSFAAAYNALGYAYRSLDELEPAKVTFEKYLELLPDEANPYDSYAELLMEMGDYEESIENYRQALEIDPLFAPSHTGISRNYSLLGEPAKARVAVEQLIAAARNFAERQNALQQSAVAWLYEGDIDAAIAVCETMVSEAIVDGDYAAAGDALEFMGDIMLDTGNGPKAEEYFAASLERRVEADTHAAAKAQARRTFMFKSGLAALVVNDVDTATRRANEYKAATEAEGTAFERRRIYELFGYLSSFDGDTEGAAANLARGDQYNPVVLYWSAVAQRDLGNRERAIELASRAANRNTLAPYLPLVRAEALQLLDELRAGEAEAQIADTE